MKAVDVSANEQGKPVDSKSQRWRDMKALYPTKYADSENSTFFDVSDILLSVNYEVERKKKYYIIPSTNTAKIKVNIGDGARVLTHQYKIPRTFKVGREIESVQDGLYGLIDETIRSVVQIRRLDEARKEVSQLEDQYLFPEVKTFREYLATVEKPEENGKAQEYRIWDEFVNQLIVSVQHVTDITSLSREGLEEYQDRRARGLEQSLSQNIHINDPKNLLQAVMDFLDSNTDIDVDILVAQERTLSYLQLIEEREIGNSVVRSKQNEIIANEFVVAYLSIRRKKTHAVQLPDNIVDHAIGSFIEGGIKGMIVLSWIGESIVNKIFKVNYEIPGWYIGAGIQFVWPYVKAPFQFATRNRNYKRGLRSLQQSVSNKLLTYKQDLR